MKNAYVIAITLLVLMAGSAFALFSEDRPVIAVIVGVVAIAGLALVAGIAGRNSARKQGR